MQKTSGNHPFSLGFGNTAGKEVEYFFRVYGGSSRTMGTTDAVSKNLKPRQRIGFRRITQQKIAVTLVGIRTMGSLFDANHAGKNITGSPPENGLVHQITTGTGSQMSLVGTLIQHAMAVQGSHRHEFRPGIAA
jgi:hypothetical protein